jgi:hypothetical protein
MDNHLATRTIILGDGFVELLLFDTPSLLCELVMRRPRDL